MRVARLKRSLDRLRRRESPAAPAPHGAAPGRPFASARGAPPDAI
jgi:hypothetical protein